MILSAWVAFSTAAVVSLGTHNFFLSWFTGTVCGIAFYRVTKGWWL